jgi:very-short-patch-repair endonuclease
MVSRNSSQELTQIVRELRKSPTLAEKKLWSALRNGQLDGVKFRRQHPVGGFIVDFYCPAARLAIELDGGVHLDSEQENYDRLRQNALSEVGVKVIRFWNSAVEGELDIVIQTIRKGVKARLTN